MLNDSDRVECGCLIQLRKLLEKTNDLYDSNTIEDNDKIKLLDKIGELEYSIRAEAYKEQVLNGEE